MAKSYSLLRLLSPICMPLWAMAQHHSATNSTPKADGILRTPPPYWGPMDTKEHHSDGTPKLGPFDNKKSSYDNKLPSFADAEVVSATFCRNLVSSERLHDAFWPGVGSEELESVKKNFPIGIYEMRTFMNRSADRMINCASVSATAEYWQAGPVTMPNNPVDAGLYIVAGGFRLPSGTNYGAYAEVVVRCSPRPPEHADLLNKYFACERENHDYNKKLRDAERALAKAERAAEAARKQIQRGKKDVEVRDPAGLQEAVAAIQAKKPASCDLLQQQIINKEIAPTVVPEKVECLPRSRYPYLSQKVDLNGEAKDPKQ